MNRKTADKDLFATTLMMPTSEVRVSRARAPTIAAVLAKQVALFTWRDRPQHVASAEYYRRSSACDPSAEGRRSVLRVGDEQVAPR
jgi:hypothetical protein